MSPETVAAEPGAHMRITSPIQHLCPIVDEIDNGTITVTWRTLRGTFELHSLRAYFKSFENAEITHEALTDTIYRELSRVPSVRIAEVTTTWTTAGMEVQCSTSPTPANPPQ